MRMNRILCYILSLLSIVFLTPVLAVVFAELVSDYNGGGIGFVFIAFFPIVLFILIILWLVEILILLKKSKNYYTIRIIFSVLIIVVISVSGGNIGDADFNQYKIEIGDLNSKSYRCKGHIAEGCEGTVYKISETYKSISFETSDSTQKQFTYRFETPQDEIKKSFIGQRVTKLKDSKTITFISRSGEESFVSIPCYQ